MKMIIFLFHSLEAGANFISAIKNNRNIIGCEIEKKYVKLSLERIKKMTGVEFNEMVENK